MCHDPFSTRRPPPFRHPVLTLTLWGLLALGPMTAARADLWDYVGRDDSSFSWKLEKNDTTAQGKVYHIDLTSQTWRDIPWKHPFRIYEPKEILNPEIMLLFITGGSHPSRPHPEQDRPYFLLANLCGARVAVLPQVPNQPLSGNRYEDDLIAQTLVNYLKDGDEDWPLLQPMVKSAVKATDAVQAWAKENGESVERFVVTGASKRGWTTWLTAAVDERVAGITPMVIPTLNLKAQSVHQQEVWGFYSD